jgi:predicted alpha-1,2-mannosidase
MSYRVRGGAARAAVLAVAVAVAMALAASFSERVSATEGVDSVDPFWGTGGGLTAPGNLFPGATTPLGLVRLSPDTRFSKKPLSYLNRTNLATAGYSWRHDEIIGFSHTRLSGTGVSEGGLFRLRPELVADPAGLTKRLSRLPLRHKEEFATPGYYRVRFPKKRLTAEVTATIHCGVHRYSKWPGEKQSLVIEVDGASGLLQNSHGEELTVAFNESENAVSVQTRLWGQFSRRYGGLPAFLWLTSDIKPERVVTDPASNHRLRLLFPRTASAVELKACISHVDLDGAKKNFAAEVAGQTFDSVRSQAQDQWKQALARIRVSSHSEVVGKIFYSALYRSLMMPTHFSDVDGRYRAFGDAIATAKNFVYRTDLSLWDTFRTTHPLYTLAYPEVQRDSVLSLLDMARSWGGLPRWPSGAGESGSMFGSPANFLLSETYVKGLQPFFVDGFPGEEALSRMAGAAVFGREPQCSPTLGYCPSNQVKASVSKTLEYAWADFATHHLAKAMGKAATAEEFKIKSLVFNNLWDSRRKFFRPKNEAGRWQRFSPHLTSYLGFLGPGTEHYAEGSAWHWRFSAPHAGSDLVKLFGGEKAFVNELNKFIGRSTRKRGALYPGAFYWHGNQHDLHAIYLFNEAGRPDLTQKWARWALSKKYGAGPSGLDGNDDGGTLSAWYVLSALGLYPQAGTEFYWLGSPLIKEAILRTQQGGDLRITTTEQNQRNVYVQRVELNGKPLCEPRIRHAELVGGHLHFVMGPKPARGGGYGCDGATSSRTPSIIRSPSREPYKDPQTS